MNRTLMINTIGIEYLTSNIEGGEYSYVQEAGSKENLIKSLGYTPTHFKLDIRFEYEDVVILIETKQQFVKKDEKQLLEYINEEKCLHPEKKIIAILANTNDEKIKVWKGTISDKTLLQNETVLDNIKHYVKLYDVSKQNNREMVMRNTYALNESLHKLDIGENLRSQFVGTTLLYLKDLVKKSGLSKIDDDLIRKLNSLWAMMDEKQIRAGIESTLNNLLDGSDNKKKKIDLLQKNVLNDQKVQNLTKKEWIEILDKLLLDIYRYIDSDSSEGQDILNLFFIAFNKYTGKADKNQAFTPDHITEFMCRLTEVDKTKVILDATCGSGSFLVQAMVKELADCRKGRKESEAELYMKNIKEKHIFGIEVEEKAYGLSTTNMLIHGDGNSNIKFGSCFENKRFIKDANPDIILMNPPYNAKPKDIPERYKKNWTVAAKNGKEDATKGMVFIHYLSDIIKEMNEEREAKNQPRKLVKLAVLLPVATAIGTSGAISYEKSAMLEENTLEAVFTLPNEIFYPGASACACCMLFTLGQPHFKSDGTPRSTFFGYCKEDGFKKKKNLGRVEQFDANGISVWKKIEQEWLDLYDLKQVKDGKSAIAKVDGDDEWLCEAYMKTDYSKLKESDFQQTLNNYLAYLIKEGKVYES